MHLLSGKCSVCTGIDGSARFSAYRLMMTVKGKLIKVKTTVKSPILQQNNRQSPLSANHNHDHNDNDHSPKPDRNRTHLIPLASGTV
jgi:hypothetical protein